MLRESSNKNHRKGMRCKSLNPITQYSLTHRHCRVVPDPPAPAVLEMQRIARSLELRRRLISRLLGHQPYGASPCLGRGFTDSFNSPSGALG